VQASREVGWNVAERDDLWFYLIPNSSMKAHRTYPFPGFGVTSGKLGSESFVCQRYAILEVSGEFY